MKRAILSLLLMLSLVAAESAGMQLMRFAGDSEIDTTIDQMDAAYGLDLSPMEKKVVRYCIRRDCPYMKNPTVREKTGAIMDKYLEYQLASDEDRPRIEREMAAMGEELKAILPRLRQKLAQDIVIRTQSMTAEQRQRIRERHPRIGNIIDNAKQVQVTRRVNVYQSEDPATGATDEWTFVTLEATGGNSLVEIIPKEVAASASLVSSDQEFTVLEDDPILEWDISARSEVTYSVPGDKSALVTDGPAIVYDKSGSPFLIIGVVLLLVLVAGGAFFLSKKKKGK
ncbi:MAG: hypothetical protein KAW41_06065 [Candidatus Diapherotrites archaeon]|nr:hypothetical protein [Candidatus Diapherotrites archaeon]